MAFTNGSFFANELGAALEETPEAIVRSVVEEMLYKIEHGLVRPPETPPPPATASPALPTPLPVHVAESVLVEDRPSWAAIVKRSQEYLK